MISICLEENQKEMVTCIIIIIFSFHNRLQIHFMQLICYLLAIYSIDNNTKSKKSNNNKIAMKGNKKTSISKRPRDTDKTRRRSKTRQQLVSKTRPSKKKLRQQQQITIKRSSGRNEKFDTNRMAQTVSRSGVPFQMARDISKKVSNKIKREAYYTAQHTKGRKSSNKSRPTQLKEKTVTAGRMRNLVSNELRDRNRSDIAASYSGQTPENTLPEEGLKDKEPTAAANRNRILHDQSKRGGGIMT